MVARQKLSEAEVLTKMNELDGWTLADGKLHKTFKFPSFVAAFGFMTRVALLAEKLDHHPEWSNTYNTVVIDLWTHDLNGVSTFDFELASRIDSLD